MLLQTQRLRMTEMLDSDRDACLRLCADVRSEKVKALMEYDAFREAFEDMTWTEIRRDSFTCMIRNREDRVIGRICMQHLSDPIPELGIDLFAAYRNQGYGPEAITAFVDWYKREHNLATVKVRIEKDNIQSIKVFEKLGAEYVGVDTLVRKAAIERFKEIFPEDDTSMLETPTILVYHL